MSNESDLLQRLLTATAEHTTNDGMLQYVAARYCSSAVTAASMGFVAVAQPDRHPGLDSAVLARIDERAEALGQVAEVLSELAPPTPEVLSAVDAASSAIGVIRRACPGEEDAILWDRFLTLRDPKDGTQTLSEPAVHLASERLGSPVFDQSVQDLREVIDQLRPDQPGPSSRSRN